MTDKKTCVNCAYYDPADNLAEDTSTVGFCRVKSPTIMHMQTEDEGPVLPVAQWPIVNEVDFCGELKEKGE